MIEVDRLTKRYGNLKAVDQVSFQVEKGEILGFLGPNGAGKTTTMRILTCFLPASEGTARVAGYDVFEDAMEVKRRIGYLPEHPPVYDEMTVDSYLKFVAKIKGVAPEDRKRRLHEVKETVRIEGYGKKLIKHLSKGFQTARRIGPGIDPRPGGPDPGRAHGGAGPQSDQGSARAHQEPCREPHRYSFDPHPARGQHDLPGGWSLSPTGRS